jgi:hypothetical protein
MQRAAVLARESVTSLVYGGPAADGALEFVLTETANDREVGATLTLILAQMGATLARLVADLEDEAVDEGSALERTVSLIEEITAGFSGPAD